MDDGSAFSGSGFRVVASPKPPLSVHNDHAKHQSTISQAYLYPSCIPVLSLYTPPPRPPSPSSPCLRLAALRLRGVSGECLSQFRLLSRTHSTSLTQLPNVLSLTSHYFLYHPHIACAYSATFRIAPQQVNARILRIHRIERYPIKSRPYLDVNIFVVL